MTPPSIRIEPFSNSVAASSMVTTTRQPSSRIMSRGRQHQAAADQRVVEPDGTRSTFTLLARILRAVEAERLAKEHQQAGARPHIGLPPDAVDARTHNHVGSLRSLSAQAIARLASTRQPCRR